MPTCLPSGLVMLLLHLSCVKTFPSECNYYGSVLCVTHVLTHGSKPRSLTGRGGHAVPFEQLSSSCVALTSQHWCGTGGVQAAEWVL